MSLLLAISAETIQTQSRLSIYLSGFQYLDSERLVSFFLFFLFGKKTQVVTSVNLREVWSAYLLLVGAAHIALAPLCDFHKDARVVIQRRNGTLA